MNKKWQEDLTKDIRFHNFEDNIDHPYNTTLMSKLIDENGNYSGNIEFTEANHKALQQAIAACKNPKCFLEIGVCRNQDKSSTYTIIKSVPENGVYLGVDIEDKSFLNNPEKGIHTIQSSSSDFVKVKAKLDELGVEKLDFIFIDGWHSINQVLDDWEYTCLLSEDGVVAFHDVTAHPGPFYFLNALNTEKWEVSPNLCPYDYGFAYCKKRK